ncbi:hypothetical protein Btru_032756 [Bulinus truncatus]|nr:hypothetical protein Btru_032756 [Bulinus truncatus]
MGSSASRDVQVKAKAAKRLLMVTQQLRKTKEEDYNEEYTETENVDEEDYNEEYTETENVDDENDEDTQPDELTEEVDEDEQDTTPTQIDDFTEDAGEEHIFISYCHANKALVHKIYNSLKDMGYSIWIDEEQMEGNLLDGMSEAVEKAWLVLMCISEHYKNSQNCRREAEYTPLS